jgi:hypothetical protein
MEMTYRVTYETPEGFVENYIEESLTKAKAIRLAKIAARDTILDAVRFFVDCVETDETVFTAVRS